MLGDKQLRKNSEGGTMDATILRILDRILDIINKMTATAAQHSNWIRTWYDITL